MSADAFEYAVTVSAAKTTNPVSRCEVSTSATGDLGRALARPLLDYFRSALGTNVHF
jgi:hypothetical protein